MAFSTSAEYAYIAVRNSDTDDLGVLEYDTESKKYKLYNTNAYPIKDNIQSTQILADRKDNSSFDLYYISDGKLKLYKSDLFCNGLLLVIAYIDHYIYCLRENIFGNNEIIRISPDGETFIYSYPGDSVFYSGSATEITMNFPIIADVDAQGRLLISSFVSPEINSNRYDDNDGSYIYVLHPNGEYYYLTNGFEPIWYTEDSIIYLTQEIDSLSMKTYIQKYCLSTGENEQISDLYIEYETDDFLVYAEETGISINRNGEIILNTEYLSRKRGRLLCYTAVNICSTQKEKIIINANEFLTRGMRIYWDSIDNS